MSVGTATICSSLARLACSLMSITSRLYRLFKCCSHTRWMFSTAAFDFNVDRLMYKRKRYLLWREREIRFGVFFMRPSCTSSSERLQRQADEHAVGVGQIADDLSDLLRELHDQRGNRDDLVPPRHLRVLQQIDDFDLVAALQMFVTE